MKFLIILILILTSCSINKSNNVKVFDQNNIFEMTVDKYKQMLMNYNNKQDNPDINK